MILDGSINWADGLPRLPAEGFDLEARKRDVYDWIRQVRGGILAGAFTVERHLSATIVYFMLGERVELREVHDAFDEGLLGPLTFERRINVAMLIAPHLLPAAEVASLKADLNDLRSLRNAMAHKPFWFHPELDVDDKVINLVPIIMRGKGALALTTALIEQLNIQISQMIAKVSNLSILAARRHSVR